MPRFSSHWPCILSRCTYSLQLCLYAGNQLISSTLWCNARQSEPSPHWSRCRRRSVSSWCCFPFPPSTRPSTARRPTRRSRHLWSWWNFRFSSSARPCQCWHMESKLEGEGNLYQHLWQMSTVDHKYYLLPPSMAESRMSGERNDMVLVRKLILLTYLK